MTEIFKGIGNNLKILEHFNNFNNDDNNNNNDEDEFNEILNSIDIFYLNDENKNIINIKDYYEINDEKFINDRMIYNNLDIFYNNDEIETLKDLCEHFKIFDNFSNINNLKLFIILSQNLNIDRETIKFFFQKISCFLYNNFQNITESNLNIIFNYLEYIYGLKSIIFYKNDINKNYFSIFRSQIILEINENNFINSNDKKSKKKDKKKDENIFIISISFKQIVNEDNDLLSLEFSKNNELKINIKNNRIYYQIFGELNITTDEKILEFKNFEIINLIIILSKNELEIFYNSKNILKKDINFNNFKIPYLTLFKNFIGEVYYINGYYGINDQNIINDFIFNIKNIKQIQKENIFIFNYISTIERNESGLNIFEMKYNKNFILKTDSKNKIHLYNEHYKNINEIGGLKVFFPFFEIINISELDDEKKNYVF